MTDGPDRSRLRAWLRAARSGLSPWDRTPEAALVAIGGRCGPEEITEALAILDNLAREKSGLPDWDGDSADDIAAAQATYMRILGHADGELLPAIAAGLASDEADTRRWVTLALGMHGAAALPFLRAAAAGEADHTTRQFIAETITRIGRA